MDWRALRWSAEGFGLRRRSTQQTGVCLGLLLGLCSLQWRGLGFRVVLAAVPQPANTTNPNNASSYQAEEEAEDGDDMGAIDLTEQAELAAAAGEQGEDEEEEDYSQAVLGVRATGTAGGSTAVAAPDGIDRSQSEAHSAAAAAAAPSAADRSILTSSIDPTAWKLEVERLAPKLRLTVPADARDWRQHLDTACAHASALTTGWTDAQAALQRLASDVGAALERLTAREAALNNQFEGALAGYAAAHAALAEAQEEAAARADGVSARDAELHRLGAALEEVKAALDARGSSLSDASPLVRVKAAITTLRRELGAMEVRIGVVGHTLLQLSQSDKQAVLRDVVAKTMGAAAAGGAAAAARGGRSAARGSSARGSSARTGGSRGSKRGTRG